MEEEYSVKAAFDKKHVMITGVTGFVGKVLLEKILRCVSQVETVYVLIREKRTSKNKNEPAVSSKLRFEKEVAKSPIFTRLRKELSEKGQNFDELLAKKVVCLNGDLSLDQLGFSQADLKLFVDNVHIILHCAATVDFNERIDQALKMNVFGALRLLNMAKRCKNIEAFIHISTAYVNSNYVQKPGNRHHPVRIRETIYPLAFDPQDVVDQVMAMSEDDLNAFSLKHSLNGVGALWPNTYTFSKCIGEHLIRDQRGHVPLAIIRPSIIGASWEEPVPGWVDSAMAAGAVYMAIGLGMARIMPGRYDGIASVVPVDLLINIIIAMVPAVKKNAAKARRKDQQPSLMLCHSCTSDVQPAYRWRFPLYVIPAYFSEGGYQPSHRLGPPHIRFTSTLTQWHVEFFLRYTVPSALLNSLASVSGYESHKKLAFNFSLLRSKLLNLTNAFYHFMINQWVFDCHNTRWVQGCLPPNEREVFYDSSVGIEWNRYTDLFCWGLAKFVLKDENCPPVASNEEYVNEFANATTYTNSLRQRLLYDFEYQANRVAKKSAKNASNAYSWCKSKLKKIETPPILLSKL